jgi:hypothetical protein
LDPIDKEHLMSALRTTLVAVCLGAAGLTTTALVATSATAAPAPVAAVEQLAAANSGTAADTASAGTASADAARTKARGWWAGLTDDQRTCLQDQDITRPVGRLADAERTALRAKVEAAAKTCGVTLPFAGARALWDGLSTEQRDCIRDAGVNRPWGQLTKEQRQAVRADLRAAAEKCGVALPARSAGRE